MYGWQICLRQHTVFKWTEIGDVWVKGYTYVDNIFYCGVKFARLLHDRINAGESFRNIIESLNGSFLIIYKNNDKIYLASDHVQSCGFLFYDKTNQVITDDYMAFNKDNNELDLIGLGENIKSLLYTIDNRTYYKNIKHVTAGEIVTIYVQSNHVKREFYYKHELKESNVKSCLEDYLPEIENLLEKVFLRLISSLNGKTAIIPLSGGYDSRLIVTMLHKLNYKNVVCYTYGYTENTEETGVSKEVANKLGYKHYYINQDDLFWQQFIGDDVVDEYLYESYDISHTPHIQEIRALKLLKEHKDFPKDGVVIPGFCGDLFGGSYTFDIKQKQKHMYSEEELCKYIRSNHFVSFKNAKITDEVIENDLQSFFRVRQCNVNSLLSFNETFGYWFCCHKVAKYVVPSVKAYEKLGFQWRLPLWDMEFTNYWYNIPMEMKQINSLYNYSLRKILFIPYDIDYRKPEYARFQIEEQHRKWVNAVGYSCIMKLFYRTGRLLMHRDSNNFVAVLRNYYLKIKNKSLIGFLENRWLEPFVLWWIEQIVGDDVIKDLFD